MIWEKYKDNFISTCEDYGIEESRVSELLTYAKLLYDQKLPVIFDIYHFSELVGYKTTYFDRAILNTHRFYKFYKIPKKQGGYRIISEPLPSLKEIQTWILDEILYKLNPSRFCQSFCKT